MKKQYLNNEHEGKEYQLEITNLSHDGAGVGAIEGYTLFVRDSLPGDRVLVKVSKANRTYGFANVIKRLRDSEQRITPPCTIFEQCGGCQLQHYDYQAQLRWKRQTVLDALQRIGKIQELQSTSYVVHPTEGMVEPWRYRNKVQVPVAYAKSTDGVAMGFYKQGTHDVIDMKTCLIQPEHADLVLAKIRQCVKLLKIPIYDEKRHDGCLRHVLIRSGYHTDEWMVVFVTNGRSLPFQHQLVAEIRAAFPQVKSIMQNINQARSNVILGKETKLLWGSEVIYDYIGGVENRVKFAISARSFFQVNSVQTKTLYDYAVAYAELTGHETVVDAYCGLGSITLFLAKNAKHVYGVEIVEQAVADARVNAQLNQIENVTFECGAAEVVIPKWRDYGVQPDVIVVDPPRQGCDQQLLDTILKMAPQRVVYVSCNPATLARDLQVLVAGGYILKEVQPVDMFPHTTHVECVILMTRV
jgi:23S rRNA (uracil1939-C5)-methyltransferase